MQAIETTTSLSMAEAEIRASLATEGFGVLTEIDVAETLANKIRVQRDPLETPGA
jgi:uncharacterized protein (DUF302 family)